MAEETKRIDAEPDATRQGELTRAYEANLAANRPPFEKVEIRTYGELQEARKAAEALAHADERACVGFNQRFDKHPK